MYNPFIFIYKIVSIYYVGYYCRKKIAKTWMYIEDTS